jgi:hypothetical protein
MSTKTAWRSFAITGDEARGRTVYSELALARECLQEARYALDGGC